MAHLNCAATGPFDSALITDCEFRSLVEDALGCCFANCKQVRSTVTHSRTIRSSRLSCNVGTSWKCASTFVLLSDVEMRRLCRLQQNNAQSLWSSAHPKPATPRMPRNREASAQPNELSREPVDRLPKRSTSPELAVSIDPWSTQLKFKAQAVEALVHEGAFLRRLTRTTHSTWPDAREDPQYLSQVTLGVVSVRLISTSCWDPKTVQRHQACWLRCWTQRVPQGSWHDQCLDDEQATQRPHEVRN